MLKGIVRIFSALTLVCFLLFSCGEKKNETSEKAVAIDTSGELKASTPINQLTEKIKAEPGNAELYNMRAKYYLAEKKYTSAMNDVTKALSIDSTKSAYYITEANIHFATLSVRKAEEAFLRAIAHDEKNIEAYLKLAELYLYLKKYKESIQNANEALRIDVHNPKAYFIKGYVAAETKDTARAVSNYETCVEQDPGNYDALLQLGIIFAARNHPIAIQYYDRALKLKPNSTEVYYDRGLFYQESGELEKAIADYNSILKIDPAYSDAYYNLGYIEVNYRKNYQKAIEFFSKALERNQYYAEAFYNRGYCYEMTGNKQKARQDYLSALAIDNDYSLPKKGMKRIGG
jgi:tetratricopeptide (TPR) repeat protein